LILKYIRSVLSTSGNTDIGILVLRSFTGLLMFFNHGMGKITAGGQKWDRLGHALTDLIGLDFLAIFFGFMASFAESIGALFIVIGLFTRVSSFLLFFTMGIASFKHLMESDFSELAFVYALISIVIMITGAGKYSADYHIVQKLQNDE
jgi:putative oxidoreductase